MRKVLQERTSLVMVAVILSCPFWQTACVQPNPRPSGLTPPSASSPYLDKTLPREIERAREVEARLAAKSPLSDREQLDLAMSQFLQEHYKEAAGTYDGMYHRADSKELRAAALLGSAQSLALAGEPRAGAEKATEASKAQPDNLDIAFVRWALWKKVGDDLELRAAAGHLSDLEPSWEGKVTADSLLTWVLMEGGGWLVSHAFHMVCIYLTGEVPTPERVKLANEIGMAIGALVAAEIPF